MATSAMQVQLGRRTQYMIKKKSGDVQKSSTSERPHRFSQPKTSSPFFNLPAELRLRIYEYLLDGPTSLLFPGFRNRRDRFFINVLITCRLLYQEFVPVAYREIYLGIHTQRSKGLPITFEEGIELAAQPWPDVRQPGERAFRYTGNLLSSKDQRPQFTRKCGNLVRKISMKYKQIAHLKEALQEIVEYTESLVERFSRLDLVDVRIVINGWNCLGRDLKRLEYEGGPDPIELLVRSLDVKLPRQLRISFSFNEKSSVSWENMGVDGPDDLEKRLLAALETMR